MRRFLIVLFLMLVLPVCSISAQFLFNNYLDMGRAELNDQKYNKAIIYFNKFIEMLPSRSEGYYFRGVAKYYLNDYDGAGIDVNKALKRFPIFPNLFVLRGAVRAAKIDYNGALSDYNIAISLDSGYIDAYYDRALTYLEINKFDKALNDCNTVLKLDKDYKNLHVILGITLSSLGRYNDAITNFCYSIEKDKTNPGIYVERGKAYMEIGKTGLAMQDFQRALQIDSLNTYALFQRGLAWMQLQDYHKALDDFNKVLRLSPGNQLAYFNRAVISSNQNDNESALNDFLNIIRQNPDNMLVYYNLGITFLRLNNFKYAIRSFDQVIHLYPDYTDAYYARSEAKKAMGDIAGAISDKRMGDAIARKNQEKSDSTKYEEGLKLLKLTHLSADFTSAKDKKGKPQYNKGDINLKSFYGLVFDPGADDTFVAYDCFGKKNYPVKTVTLRSIKTNSESTTDFQIISKKDSSRAQGKQSSLFYLKRGVLYAGIMQYNKALNDLDTARARDPENILVYFARANIMLVILDSYLSDSASKEILTPDKKDWILTNYAQILINYNTVISMDPDFFYAYYNRAYARFLMQDYNGALSDFEKAQKERRLPQASFNAGLLNILLGNKNAGCTDLSVAGAAGIIDAYKIIRKYCN